VSVAAANATAATTRVDRDMPVLSAPPQPTFTVPCKLSHYQRFRPQVEGDLAAPFAQVTRV
jgi:hypothetical protein